MRWQNDLTSRAQTNTTDSGTVIKSVYQQKEGRSWTGSKSGMTLHTVLCYGDAAAVMVSGSATELLNDPTINLCVCVRVCACVCVCVCVCVSLESTVCMMWHVPTPILLHCGCSVLYSFLVTVMNRIIDKINQQVMCQHHHKMTNINIFLAYQKNEKQLPRKTNIWTKPRVTKLPKILELSLGKNDLMQAQVWSMSNWIKPFGIYDLRSLRHLAAIKMFWLQESHCCTSPLASCQDLSKMCSSSFFNNVLNMFIGSWVEFCILPAPCRWWTSHKITCF